MRSLINSYVDFKQDPFLVTTVLQAPLNHLLYFIEVKMMSMNARETNTVQGIFERYSDRRKLKIEKPIWRPKHVEETH
jgi:hypothetical protein